MIPLTTLALCVSLMGNATAAQKYRPFLTREVRFVWSIDEPVSTFAAQIRQESGFDETARSSHAGGLAQFTPATAEWIGRAYPELAGGDMFNWKWAIRALVRYDQHLHDRLPDDGRRWELTLRAYNGGLGWIQKEMRACNAEDAADLAAKAAASHGHAIADVTSLQTSLDAKVALTGNQTVAGVKTLSSAPIISSLTGILKGNGASAVTAIAAPAFRAYLSAGQSITNATWTKCQHNTKSYDTTTAYDAATNFRFTPLVAGYYIVVNHVSLELTTDQMDVYAVIYKNGAAASSTRVFSSAANTTFASVVDIIYCNGSTDYLEAYCRHESAAAKILTNSVTSCYFAASLLVGV